MEFLCFSTLMEQQQESNLCGLWDVNTGPLVTTEVTDLFLLRAEAKSFAPGTQAQAHAQAHAHTQVQKTLPKTSWVEIVSEGMTGKFCQKRFTQRVSLRALHAMAEGNVGNNGPSASASASMGGWKDAESTMSTADTVDEGGSDIFDDFSHITKQPGLGTSAGVGGAVPAFAMDADDSSDVVSVDTTTSVFKQYRAHMQEAMRSHSLLMTLSLLLPPVLVVTILYLCRSQYMQEEGGHEAYKGEL